MNIFLLEYSDVTLPRMITGAAAAHLHCVITRYIWNPDPVDSFASEYSEFKLEYHHDSDVTTYDYRGCAAAEAQLHCVITRY